MSPPAAPHASAARPRILLLGRNGQVGWELRRTLSPLGEITAVDREEADFSRPDSLRALVREFRPGWIVNAAAYTAVDKAESEPDLARLINAEAPGVLAEEAKALGATLVHYSTDYVFDGTKPEPYTEDDAPNPLNVYGATKLAGEQAIRATGCNHLILRTSWVYGLRGSNFLLTMLRLAREHKELRVVDDQIGAPTWCRGIAEATAAAMIQIIVAAHARSDEMHALTGTYHLTAADSTSWHGFACRIVDLAWASVGRAPQVSPIRAAEYRAQARRPANSRLTTDKLCRVFGLRLEGWAEQLECCLSEFK
jgi:dTDP-4-dehydrorhamnose reductase